MDTNSVCLFVFVLILLFECGFSQSPCPDIFGFFTDGKDVFGQITLQPVETVSSLEIKISFTVQADLGDYLGRIKDPDEVLDKYNKGETVIYRVYFPVTKPRPKVTEISLNGKTICTGPGDKPTTRTISHPTLQLTNSYGVGGGPPPYKRFQHQPQTTQIPTTRPTPRPTPRPMSMPQRIPRTTKDYALAFAQNLNNRFGTSNSASSPFHPFFEAQSPPVTQTTMRPTPPKKLEYSHNLPETQTTERPTPPIKLEYSHNLPETQTTKRPTPVMKKPRPDHRYTPSTTTDECGVLGNEVKELVYKGQSYERGQIPWLVALFKSKRRGLEFICGGTLVTDRHVVTAAHCKQLKGVTIHNREFVVKVGAYSLDDWSDDLTVTSKIMNATMHEFYDGVQTLQNDIMVLTLAKRIKFNKYIRPACLWSGDTELSRVVGDTGVVAGWGDRGDDSMNPLEKPQLVRMPIVSTSDCRASKSAFHEVTFDTTFCAGDRAGAGPCSGDSGSGLYLLEDGRWRLRGIVSLSLKTIVNSCNLNEYVVFTDTAQYLPWIRNILSQKYFD